MVGECTAAASYDFLLLPVAPGVSCSCVDARLTRSSKLRSPPAISRRLSLSPNVCNPSKLTPQPPSKVAVAGVPFVDIMTTMCDASIPLTVGEWEEWGNPNEVHILYS